MTVDFEEQGWRYLDTAARRAAGAKSAARVFELSPGDGAAREGKGSKVSRHACRCSRKICIEFIKNATHVRRKGTTRSMRCARMRI